METNEIITDITEFGISLGEVAETIGTETAQAMVGSDKEKLSKLTDAIGIGFARQYVIRNEEDVIADAEARVADLTRFGTSLGEYLINHMTTGWDIGLAETISRIGSDKEKLSEVADALRDEFVRQYEANLADRS